MRSMFHALLWVKERGLWLEGWAGYCACTECMGVQRGRWLSVFFLSNIVGTTGVLDILVVVGVGWRRANWTYPKKKEVVGVGVDGYCSAAVCLTAL